MLACVGLSMGCLVVSMLGSVGSSVCVSYGCVVFLARDELGT